MQNQDTIQSKTKPIHSRLVVIDNNEENKQIEIPGMKINNDAAHKAHDLVVIYGIIMKVRCIVIPEELQKQALQIHSNHMGTEKTRLL